MQRRQLLIAAPAAVLAACGGDVKTDGPAGDRADLAVLGAALELETTLVALYEAAPEPTGLLEEILAHERSHVEGIRQAILDLRGRPARAEPAELPPLRDFARVAHEYERRAAEAYSAALPRLKNQRLRGMFASIIASEAQHATALAETFSGPEPLERVLPL